MDGSWYAYRSVETFLPTETTTHEKSKIDDKIHTRIFSIHKAAPCRGRLENKDIAYEEGDE